MGAGGTLEKVTYNSTGPANLVVSCVIAGTEYQLYSDTKDYEGMEVLLRECYLHNKSVNLVTDDNNTGTKIIVVQGST